MKRSTDAGFAIVTAIFLLVVLGALGAFMVTLSGTHQATPFQSINATRVYFGAKAGVDWGIQQAIATASCAPTITLNLTQNALNGVTVVVICTLTAHTGGNVYRITSTASRGAYGSIDYSRRVMQATVTNVP